MEGTEIGSSAPRPASSLRSFTARFRREVRYSVAGSTWGNNIYQGDSPSISLSVRMFFSQSVRSFYNHLSTHPCYPYFRKKRQKQKKTQLIFWLIQVLIGAIGARELTQISAGQAKLSVEQADLSLKTARQLRPNFITPNYTQGVYNKENP